MPTVRKLSEEEVAEIERRNIGQRKQVEQEYDRLLADFVIGDYGELEPGKSEKRTTVRNRIIAAASRRDMKLVLMRTKGDNIRFRIVGSDEHVADDEDNVVQSAPELEVSVSSDPPAKRRVGRPRKQAA